MASTIKVDTITTPDGTGNISVDRPLSGSGAGLTSLPAANLTGALPAISGASLTGLSAGAWSVKSSGTLSSASEFIVTNLSKTTKIFMDITVSADSVYTTMETSSNNGSSYDNTTGDISQTGVWGTEANTTVYGQGIPSSTVEFNPSPNGGLGNASGESCSMEWTIYNPANASTETLLEARHLTVESDGNLTQAWFVGKRNETAIVNAVRIYPRASGTFSGTYTVIELN